MIVGAGPMVKLVLVILLIFSIVSWAIMFARYIFFRRLEKESRVFLKYFWEKKQFGPIFEMAANNNSPFAKMFIAGYTEISNLKKTEEDKQVSEYPHMSFEITGIDAVERTLKKAMSIEVARMETTVPFLATTGNTTPFIGLFGTVWGIMDSFRHIGLKGSANLAVVAPGISEALIATAMGLFAAIPAVIAYNHYVMTINRIASEMENFSADFLNIVERHFLKTGLRGHDTAVKK
ncbi:MAG: protein TolQ [Deltaproteobacteria bacterium]|nr:protein TolQ [Deltaproteobacteria bacterium]